MTRTQLPRPPALCVSLVLEFHTHAGINQGSTVLYVSLGLWITLFFFQNHRDRERVTRTLRMGNTASIFLVPTLDAAIIPKSRQERVSCGERRVASARQILVNEISRKLVHLWKPVVSNESFKFITRLFVGHTKRVCRVHLNGDFLWLRLHFIFVPIMWRDVARESCPCN